MSLEQNKAVFCRIFEEVYNQRNLAAIEDVYHPDYALLNAAMPDVSGIEAVKQFVAGYLAAFPDMHYTIDDVIAEGDKVVVRWTATGTHQGEMMGIPATGKQVTVSGISIARIVDGKVKEDVSNHDALGMMQQLGVIPPMGGGGE